MALYAPPLVYSWSPEWAKLVLSHSLSLACFVYFFHTFSFLRFDNSLTLIYIIKGDKTHVKVRENAKGGSNSVFVVVNSKTRLLQTFRPNQLVSALIYRHPNTKTSFRQTKLYGNNLGTFQVL